MCKACFYSCLLYTSVGVNVPNASVMVIENAERFGLAQLHQLRGRVGRGKYESWCFLVAEPSERLRLLTQTTDGFKIAEKDMELRGPGEMFAERQSGMLSTGLSMLAGDTQLLKLTHDEARDVYKRQVLAILLISAGFLLWRF